MRKILVIGSGYFKQGFRLLESDGYQLEYLDKDTQWQSVGLLDKYRIIRHYDVVHYFWARVRTSEILLGLLLGKRVILHYVGSDVVQTLKSKRKVLIQRILARVGVLSLADSEYLAQSLKGVKIKSTRLYFMNRMLVEAEQGYPSQLTVLCYIPDGKEKFYGLEQVLYCAEKMPDTEFLLLRNTGASNLPNVRSLGFVPEEEIYNIYNLCNVYVRMTQHDSLSCMVLELLACGRHVIWTYPFPHCFQANSKDELYKLLSDKFLFRYPNKDGKEYVLNHFSNEALKQQYHTVWDGRDIDNSGDEKTL